MNAVRAYSGTFLLYCLHLIIALSLPFVLVLVVGCMKISEEVPDYGPEVSGDAIDLALSKALHGASLNGTAVGQRLKYSIVRRLENEEVTTLLGGIEVEVFDRQDTATEARFMMKVTKSERTSTNGEFEVKITEEPLVLTKASLVASMSRVSPMVRAASKVHGSSKDVHAKEERKVAKITFHKLREFTQTEPPPKAVRERAGCGGLSPCEIELRYIRFDAVQWYEDGGRQKIAFDYAFSVQTPFLPFGPEGNFDQLSGLIFTNCQSLYVPIEGRTVFVRDCQNLEDFQK